MKLPGNFGLDGLVPVGKTYGRKNDGGRNAPALFKEGKSPHLPAILLDAGRKEENHPPVRSFSPPRQGTFRSPSPTRRGTFSAPG